MKKTRRTLSALLNLVVGDGGNTNIAKNAAIDTDGSQGIPEETYQDLKANQYSSAAASNAFALAQFARKYPKYGLTDSSQKLDELNAVHRGREHGEVAATQAWSGWLAKELGLLGHTNHHNWQVIAREYNNAARLGAPPPRQPGETEYEFMKYLGYVPGDEIPGRAVKAFGNLTLHPTGARPTSMSGAEALRKERNLKMIPYNPEGKTYREAVKRMASRALEMEDHSGYLSWVREANPELADRIESLMADRLLEGRE